MTEHDDKGARPARLQVPAAGSGFRTPVLDRAIPMAVYLRPAFPAAGPQRGRDRALHRVLRVIDRMQCPAWFTARQRPS